MNKLETLQQKTNGIIFIKSYPILNIFNPAEKQLFELILSFQDNEKKFEMKYINISKLLNIKKQSVKDIICKHKKTGIIITDHKSNYNGTDGGSHTTLSIDVDKLISIIESKSNTADLSNDKSEDAQTVQPTEIIESALVFESNKDQSTDFDEIFKTPFYVKDENEYSTQQFMLNNSNSVLIPKKYLIYWNDILNQKGTIKNLKSEYSQKTFDYKLDEIIEAQNNRKLILNKIA
jgi:hypothetical protein